MSKLVDGKNCPFCDATKLSVECKTSRDSCGTRETYAVRCNCCHARGGTVSGYVKPGVYMTKKIEIVSSAELITKAIEKWNTRC